MTIRSVLFNKEPVWHENRLGSRHTLPEAVQSWTYEFGSLTKRLRAIYGNGVAVRLLFQQWRVPFLSERRLIHLPEHQLCLTREVLLSVEQTPLILARTIIPTPTIKIANRQLTRLGTRPLGEVIFSYPHLERIAMDITQIPVNHWTAQTQQIANIEQTIHGRRTVYAINNQPLLVSEFFLPEIITV